jgi:hypothetical protein
MGNRAAQREASLQRIRTDRDRLAAQLKKAERTIHDLTVRLDRAEGRVLRCRISGDALPVGSHPDDLCEECKAVAVQGMASESTLVAARLTAEEPA